MNDLIPNIGEQIYSNNAEQAVDGWAEDLFGRSGGWDVAKASPGQEAHEDSSGNVTLHQRKNLKRGDKGSDIGAMQAALNKLGYDAGTPDGSYGPKTESAILAFQRNNNIPATGVANQATREVLNSGAARKAKGTALAVRNDTPEQETVHVVSGPQVPTGFIIAVAAGVGIWLWLNNRSKKEQLAELHEVANQPLPSIPEIEYDGDDGDEDGDDE